MRLPAEEVACLHAMLRTSNHPRRQWALNELLIHYKGLALITARRIDPQNPLIDMADLRQEAMLALAHCIEHYDPLAGASFKTYAIGWIRGTCFNYVSKQYSKEYLMPRAAVFSRLKKNDLPIRKQWDEEAEEVSRTASQAIWNDVLKRLEPNLWDYVDRLKDPDPALIRLVYVEEVPHKEIARRYGKSPSWCSMRLAAAYKRLRTMMEGG